MDDLISRQQAIDALKTDMASLDHIIKGMSAHDVRLDAYVSQRNQVDCDIDTISNLPPAQPEQRWIPVSERLPEDGDYKPFSYYEDGAVLFCTKDDKIGFGWCYESTKQWANEDDKSPGEVIAWMPLPEPYQEGR